MNSALHSDSAKKAETLVSALALFDNAAAYDSKAVYR